MQQVSLGIGLYVDHNAGKKHWLEDPVWQGTRKAIEAIMGSGDYLEQYFATNLVFEPLVEFGRPSGSSTSSWRSKFPTTSPKKPARC